MINEEIAELILKTIANANDKRAKEIIVEILEEEVGR